MRIQPFTSGICNTNSFVAYGYASAKALVVDAPDGNDAVVAFLRKEKLEPEAILLTHGHFDHVMGLPTLLEAYPGTPVFVSKNDYYLLEDKGAGNMELFRTCFPSFEKMLLQNMSSLPEEYKFYEDEAFDFKVIPTPGHTPGSVSLHNVAENLLFSGDTLFASSYGRTDFPRSSARDIARSLRTLLALPEDTLVLPGHGTGTTIGRERNNLYI